MVKPKVLITNPEVPNIASELLKPCCEIIEVKDHTRDAILQNVSDVDALFWATHHKLDKEILDKAGSKLKIVATMSAGYNHIDVDELKSRGIKFGNTPNVLNDAVADLAVLLALAASRRFQEGRQQVERGRWDTILGRDIRGSTVGIVGLGGIGQTIVKRLKSFDVGKFLYTGHKEKVEGKELGAQFVSLDTLVKTSDFVIVSCPLSKETENLFNSDIFNKMKSTSVFVNISRGAIVDQDALVKALKERKIYAAGLDVTTPEPLPSDHELIKLPNCVLSPHMGSATEKTRSEMAALAANNILKALNGEEMLTPLF